MLVALCVMHGATSISIGVLDMAGVTVVVLVGDGAALMLARSFQAAADIGPPILDLVAIALGVIQTIALAWITANTRVKRK